ncbi:hypothetical protein GQ44DRAFT_699794 [Phaeosphaeriaceae sp. PMI808]|nr:hypothetical protein GQ44DRAFT_699794 [Phaeosphaeriaceae sp. PMI808]
MNIFKPDPGEKTRCQPSRSIETIDLTESPEPPSTPVKERTFVLPTRPSPSKKGAQYNPDLSFQRLSKRKSHMSIFPEPVHKPVSQEKPSAPRRIESYKSLQDFYSLLDRIERTSYVGAVFLEAYAERLRGDMCKNCWMKHNVIIPYN